MLQSQAPILKISLVYISFLLIYANSDETVDKQSQITDQEQPRSLVLDVQVSQDAEGIEANSTPSLDCRLEEAGEIWWTLGGKNLTTIVVSPMMGRVDIKMASRNDTGNYTCHARTLDGRTANETRHIRIIEPGKIMGGEGARARVGSPATLSCHVQGFPLSNFTWVKHNDTEGLELRGEISVVALNETYVTTTLNFTSVGQKDNGTYECQARDYNRLISSARPLKVVDSPRVHIDFMKAVSTNSIYLNWTVVDNNDPIEKYYIQYLKNGTEQWVHYSEEIGGRNSSYVLKRLDKNSAYKFRIFATNSIGQSQPLEYPHWITTLDKDPEFVPNVTLKGNSMSSIDIFWSVPPEDVREYVHYYNIYVTNTASNHSWESTETTVDKTSHDFNGLSPATTYLIKVAACSEYTKNCSEWSKAIEGSTMDGEASPPRNISVNCEFDVTTNKGRLSVIWHRPENPNGVIHHYDLVLNGTAQFRNNSGRRDIQILNLPKSVDAARQDHTFTDIPPNTNYTISIKGVTRQRIGGREGTARCTLPVTIPDTRNLNARSWRKIEDQGRRLFQLHLPRMSERNGPICCYRIFLVKLGNQQTVADLEYPQDMEIGSYERAHEAGSGGAYLAEMFDSDQLASEIFLGDNNAAQGGPNCERCIGLRPRALPPLINMVPEAPISAVTNFTTSSTPILTSEKNTPASTRRRRADENEKFDAPEDTFELKPLPPRDGHFDENANYTGFVEVIVADRNSSRLLPAYSSYFNPLYAGPDAITDRRQNESTMTVPLQICIALLVIVLIILAALCILHRYMISARQRGEDIITLRNSFRHLCRTLRGRHQLVASSPPDMPPISKADLLQAYLDRHRDSDYGFQHEFELLPDRFADRTTRASEARENLYKNRYPDIKCYDQTRVRLVQVDGICGSDYINANFVLGYKERKKFICAQGPMENTVCDYWRMIWEQHLELVLMLTNLEEYSKTKCAKYWPDKTESKTFGDIAVEHIREKPYSDYVVRELKMTRTGERESRIIVQYHFLVWKDFMAPEHPHAILRFIKRVNEAYSLEKGPILVHCSAGVGRTGTLVALDSLLQQLSEEGQVSIFNTVCDLRHQRNFLVQSLKQYIFVYRALMEMAEFGDTEIPANQLKTIVDKSRHRDNGKDKSKMEEEYEKISSVVEDRKSFSVGGGVENRVKNRNELVIPYDRNRVILTPVPGREHSTYINASFIEGYDNSESFIITQDPLETTIPDFWRMISEQCASTIVTLSDLTEGPRKCPRYWPDDEATYDHIRVRYIQSESCPYYTRRELCVSNTKTDESIVVTQYHYHGWPTVEGEVPEVTRGLIELVDQTTSSDVELVGPLVVHCNSGSDRSSMFVALSILVQQLRMERRVDIFTTTKKLRSQRYGMISSFAQYEFLHRAIVNYYDLHKFAEDEIIS